MEEDNFCSGVGVGTRTGNGGAGDSSRASSSFLKSGDRQMFTVELRPGETTIVSWKKLVKDANKANGLNTVPEPPANPNPAVECRIDPGQPIEDEVKDPTAPNRFNAVIEKIERLYMGKDSSDEEDLIPDDDQYDTEDSFIDDTELDEYFEVDDSAIKHDGFFVNRGKLERIEPSGQPNQQLKKRRRKDLEKGHPENHDGRSSNKHTKVGKTTTGKSALMVAKSFSNLSQNMAITHEHLEDGKLQNPLIPGHSSKKKSGDTKMILDPSPSSKVYNGDISTSVAEAKDADSSKPGVFPPKNPGTKSKESCGPSDSLQQNILEKVAHAPSKPQPGRPCTDEIDSSIQMKEKHGIRELPDINLPAAKYSMQTAKTPYVHKKDGSSVRPKSSLLEKAIRELEKMVAESRPPLTENPEADNSSQAIKRRLPREIKLKLAKVARLAASNGKLSKGLINRLMSSLGHFIQLRTLKRNLKIMVNMGISVKQEKDDRFQQIKKEVIEMIKIRPLSLESKAIEQQGGAPQDIRELVSEEKGVPRKKFAMDPSLEDKICDLYDLFVDGLDEDAGPQIRKLYAELAELWPNGFMDNHGIKRAICRAKERRRALHGRHKDQEKIKRKKILPPRVDETVRNEVGTVAQPQYARERLASESGPQPTPVTKAASVLMVAAAQLQSPSMSVGNLDRLKSEKMKVSSSSSHEDTRIVDGALTKKKTKRKAEVELEETHNRPEKASTQHGDEKHKSTNKPTASHPPKPNIQSAAPSSMEQSS
ncbi:ubinuclein-1-like isoform X2 [Cucumis melo var. makuwa]|uniref:Ubinuclein-1-like isoform X2 n=1 Tax=Cucumis melo var. makuwa TaxID=1194695 RepID=A0A5D3B6W4_CUCMM|nr:ubinuclein-1-like isoform X2 [Cucumis melo var. makuwa]